MFFVPVSCYQSSSLHMLQNSMPEDFDIKHCSFCTSWSPARSKLGGFCFSSDLFQVSCGRECNCKGALETVFFSNVTCK